MLQRKFRTKLKMWLDRNGITQKEFAKFAEIDESTVSKACKNKDYTPNTNVMKKILAAIRKVDHSHTYRSTDFWDI
ncbi:helix-turn-helix transcriptional regulator [Bacillus sp. OTU530]|uniref:helix-turn-helix transcriptional regulator n=1 Tax=Bacillus sp. OTU530 TaxID=3043862 RepID=UPI00313CBD13